MTQTLTAYLRVHLAGTPVLVPREAVQSVRGLSGSVLPLAGKTPRPRSKTGHSRLVVDAARLLGLAFVGYVVTTVLVGMRLRWPMWALLVALLAAVPPLLTWPVEWWFRRRGLLSDR